MHRYEPRARDRQTNGHIAALPIVIYRIGGIITTTVSDPCLMCENTVTVNVTS